MIKDLIGLSFKKIRFYLALLGALVILAVSVIMRFDKEGLELRRFSGNFMDLIYHGKYTKAFQYIDSSKIKIEELKEISELASHYYPDVIYTIRNKPLCVVGFKPITFDKDKNNDEALEFWITKIDGKWKVINIYSVLGKPLYK